MDERAKRWLKFLAALAISAVFTYLFVRGIDLGDVGDSLTSANYAYVVPGLALFGLAVFFRAVRWRLLLLPERDLGAMSLLPSVLISYAGNNLLPLRAGELVRAQHLIDRFSIPRMQTFGVLIMERIFDGFVLAGFVLWGLLLVEDGGAYLGVGLVLAVGTLFGLAVCWLMANRPDIPRRIATLPIPLAGDRLRQEIE